jgi:hypothetical protein
MIKRGSILVFLLFCCISEVFSQSYFNEFGKRIVKTEYEDKILNGPYFGVPGDQPGDMKLVHRMPVGVTDAKLFYQKLGLEADFASGKPLIVIYYPGKDECNSTRTANDPKSLTNDHKAILRYAEKHKASEPVYVYQNPHGLEKYEGIMTWIPDPDGVFKEYFFKFPYPCKSFVVFSPKGNYRAILGDFPISQIDVALKKL